MRLADGGPGVDLQRRVLLVPGADHLVQRGDDAVGHFPLDPRVESGCVAEDGRWRPAVDDHERAVAVGRLLEGEGEQLVTGLVDVHADHDGPDVAGTVRRIARAVHRPDQYDGALGLGDGGEAGGSDEEPGDAAERARAEYEHVGILGGVSERQ